uniref:Uncharacterized protein n=1 Tax=Heterosigma akashiwo TaxID=2829 RepID=A0A6V1RN98_HETAK
MQAKVIVLACAAALLCGFTAFCSLGASSHAVPVAVNPHLDSTSARRLQSEHYHLEACELDSLKSHKTVCCSDMDFPALGGVDLVELTKGLLQSAQDEFEGDAFEDAYSFDFEIIPDNQIMEPSKDGERRRLALDADGLKELNVEDFLFDMDSDQSSQAAPEPATTKENDVPPVVEDVGSKLEEEETEEYSKEEDPSANEEESGPESESKGEEGGEIEGEVVEESPNGTRLPVLGSEEFAGFLPTNVGMFKFLFSSAENRDAFLADPWKYVPAYGGFDAAGIALEEKAHEAKYAAKLGPLTDLSNWEVLDDRLFFFGSLKNKNAFKAKEGAADLGDAAWRLYYGLDASAPLTEGYVNTNCFQRTTYEMLAAGTVSVEREVPKNTPQGGSGGGGGGGGGGGSEGGGTTEYIYQAPPTLRDQAQGRWGGESLDEVLDMRSGREFYMFEEEA